MVGKNINVCKLIAEGDLLFKLPNTALIEDPK